MDNTELLKKYAAYKKVDFSTLEKDFKKSSAFYQKEFIQKIKKSIDFEEESEAKYGGIHIKPENKGKFTEYANRKGMGVQEAAHWVMSNSDNPTLRKRANFAINASKFKHQYGGSSILSQLNLL